jgi:hypothetical protein
MEYRAIYWEGGHAPSFEYSLANKLLGFGSILLNVLQHMDFNALADVLTFMAVRTQMLSWFMIVVSMTPSMIPFSHFSNLQFLFLSFIPRVFYPDKPTDEKAQIFGHRYGLLGREDFTTSANVGVLIDFYMPFGLLSLFLGMALIFLMLKYVSARIIGKGVNDWNVLLGSYFFVYMGGVLDSGYSSIGGVVYKTILIYFLLKVLRAKKSFGQLL